MAGNKTFIRGIILKDGICLSEEVENTWETVPLEVNLSKTSQLEVDVAVKTPLDKDQFVNKESLFVRRERLEANIKYMRQEREVLECKIKKDDEGIKDLQRKIIESIQGSLSRYISKLVKCCEAKRLGSVTRKDVEKYYSEAKQEFTLSQDANKFEGEQYIKNVVSRVKGRVLEVMNEDLNELEKKQNELERKRKEKEAYIKGFEQRLEKNAQITRMLVEAKNKKEIKIIMGKFFPVAKPYPKGDSR